MSASRTFPGKPGSVSAARRFVQAEIGSAPAQAAEAIAIAVSELTANCVRHAGTDFTVAVDRSRDSVRVEVADTGAGVPTVRSPAPTEHSGRGLFLVRALCDDWGIEPATDGPGKSVWFTIGVAAETSQSRSPLVG